MKYRIESQQVACSGHFIKRFVGGWKGRYLVESRLIAFFGCLSLQPTTVLRKRSTTFAASQAPHHPRQIL